MTDRPDPGDDLRGLLADCVHCGFCLSACPTYLLDAAEPDSPRGRIQLIGQIADAGTVTPVQAAHLDNCLGCLACMPACPSGVRYDRLIEHAREQVEEGHSRSRRERILRGFVFALFPHPARLRLIRPALWVYQRFLARLVSRLLPGVLRDMAALAPEVRNLRSGSLPALTPPTGPRRAVVGLVTGCVQRVFFPEVNRATAQVLAAEGCEVRVPRAQGCCGALSAHAGRTEEARRFARGLIEAFEDSGADIVVVNAAGCGATVKDYGHLLADDPEWADRATRFAAKVRDATEWLAELGPGAAKRPVELNVAYQDACHLRNGQGIVGQPRTLLNAVPGLELREVAEPGVCCGSAGIYNLLQPDTAARLGDRKAEQVRATGADVLATANPGCAMQIRQALRRSGSDIPVMHVMEVLALGLADQPDAEGPFSAGRRSSSR
ncbi:(Fe-S)-binding protein [Rhizohabitans arisaemae]|uniref:(Fe-S)-binding protein n=1 Tax=Rhizohabitans arisaemae TaxID=2720610 RepID=UPI0024B1CCD5|nr:heterodisulfide reductase-related iron-sulfur binding cluster [Rhizohabitans arisaemae]